MLVLTASPAYRLPLHYMKTKLQKQEELAEAKKLLEKSSGLIFADFTKVTAEDLRKFRREIVKQGGRFLVIKKRLLALLLKEKGIDVDLRAYKVSIGTIFAENGVEGAAGPAFKFFKGLDLAGRCVEGRMDKASDRRIRSHGHAAD